MNISHFKRMLLNAAPLSILFFAAVLIAPSMVMAEEESAAKEDAEVETDADDTDVSDEEPLPDEVWDPLEPVNRGVFWFNDKLDIYILEPVARGYDDVVPDSVQEGVGNFFDNLKYPTYFVSDVVQLKFTQAAEHTGRFILNTTVGLLGIIDVAKHVGLERHKEDFGIALAYHGVPPGPYLVLPILGPSNFRDGVGRVVDSFLDPISALTYTHVDDDITIPVIIGAKVIDAIDTRANLLEAVETAKEASLDYYLFVQGAYHQHRLGILYDGNVPPEEMGESVGPDPFKEDTGSQDKKEEKASEEKSESN